MKKNIGSKFALYPTPATVIGTVGEDGKVNFLLVAHIGIVSHSKLLVSMHNVHFSNQAVKVAKKLSINLISEDWVAQADYAGTVSGARLIRRKCLNTIWARMAHLSLKNLPFVWSAR